jgi:hypothetical protein
MTRAMPRICGSFSMNSFINDNKLSLKLLLKSQQSVLQTLFQFDSILLTEVLSIGHELFLRRSENSLCEHNGSQTVETGGLISHHQLGMSFCEPAEGLEGTSSGHLL